MGWCCGCWGSAVCTAVTFHGRDGFYMGRTLDYERSFGEQVVVTPRRFPLRFRHGETLEEHYALVGMAHVAEGWPLCRTRSPARPR